METLKRKNEAQDGEPNVKLMKDSDSEDEEDLLERLFGTKNMAKQASCESVKDEEIVQEDVKPADEGIVNEPKSAVWEDDGDDKEHMKSAEERFSEFSGGWVNLKKSTEEAFSGKVFSKSKKDLPVKVLDVQACGTLGGMLGQVSNFQFHHRAPVAVITQNDRLSMYEIDGKENKKLQSINFDKFKVKDIRIISDHEVLCTSYAQWFYSYDMTHGSVTRYPYILGNGKQSMTKMYTNPNSKFIAFPRSNGGICIVSKQKKEYVDTLQSGTNSSVDCHISNDGNRLWSLSENGEVMCFDLRQMKAVNSFTDFHGATSLAINHQETMFSVGSNSGIISIYDETCQIEDEVKPMKTIKNLQAPITTQIFNRYDDLALFASGLVAGQTKLFHAKSQSLFANFPGTYKLDAVKLADFSPNSGFLGVGKHSVKLFRLKHYPGY